MSQYNFKFHHGILYAFSVLLLSACGGEGGNTPPVSNLPALTISAASITEGNTGSSDLSFRINLSAVATGDVTLDYATKDGTAEAGVDYTSSSGTLTIAGGDTEVLIMVPIIGELCFEEDETFSVSLSNVSSNATLSQATSTGMINNDDEKRLSIADSEVLEGNSGTTEMHFTVSLDQPSCVDTQASFTTNAITADSLDFNLVTDSFTLPAGDSQVDIVVEVSGDTAYELDETLSVNIENLPAHVVAEDAEAFGTIRTDDFPTLTISAVEMLEGNSGSFLMVFPLQLAGITNEISVDYATSDITAMISDNDYVETTGTLVIPAGETSATIEVEIIGDTTAESNEDFLLTLSNLVGDAQLITGLDKALGTIEDNDTPVVIEPRLTVSVQGGFESSSSPVPVLFGFHLNTPLTQNVVVDYVSSDLSGNSGVATESDDYTSVSGRLRINAGDTYGEVSVIVLDDLDIENLEYFVLDLTLISTNVELNEPRAYGLIFDDDYVGPPMLSAANYTAVFEGDSGTRNVSVIVALSAPASTVVTVDYATHDSTALAGSDYTATSGTLSFDIGETLKSIDIPIHGDTVIEAHEELTLSLSNLTGNAILFYDPVVPPLVVIETDEPFAMVSVTDVAQRESDAGTNDMLFTVSIDATAGDPVTMDYSSVADTATDSEDYTGVSGSLSIPAGATETTLALSINGDTDLEYDERFAIQLNNVSQNAEFADDSGFGTIINDDNSVGWGLSQKMNQDGQDNQLPQVVMTASGDAQAVWFSNLNVDYESSFYTLAGGWLAYEQVVDFASRYFDLTMDDNGRSTVGYIFGTATVVQHTLQSGWQAELEFDPTSYHDQDYMNVVSNGSGDALAVWKMNTQNSFAIDHIMYSVYDPVLDQWSTPEYVEFEGEFLDYIHVDMNDNGDAVAVWTESGIRVSFYDFASNSWSTPQPISNESSPGFYQIGYLPKAAIDNDGNVIVVWDDGRGIGVAAHGSVWARRYVAATGLWDDLEQLELTTADGTDAQIAMDAKGNAFVVWMQDNIPDDTWNDSFEIHARRYDVATDSWGADILVQNSDTRVSKFGFNISIPLDVPSLAVDPSGNAILAWSQKIEDDFVIRVSKFDISKASPTWSPSEIISGNAWPYAIFPDIAIDANGHAQVVWMAGDTVFFDVLNGDVSEIWGSRFTP